MHIYNEVILNKDVFLCFTCKKQFIDKRGLPEFIKDETVIEEQVNSNENITEGTVHSVKSSKSYIFLILSIFFIVLGVVDIIITSIFGSMNWDNIFRALASEYRWFYIPELIAGVVSIIVGAILLLVHFKKRSGTIKKVSSKSSKVFLILSISLIIFAIADFIFTSIFGAMNWGNIFNALASEYKWLYLPELIAGGVILLLGVIFFIISIIKRRR